jgi:predicted transcriptional regulator
MDELHTEFVSEVRARMSALGMTQEQLAKRLNLKQPNVARMLAGEHCPTLATVTKIAEALNCTATLKLLGKK